MPVGIRQPKWDHMKSICYVLVKINDFEIYMNNLRCKSRCWSAISKSLGFCTMDTL